MTDSDSFDPPYNAELAEAAGKRQRTTGGSGGRVLVTGASGFLGRQVCSALVQDGYRVTGLVRQLPKPEFRQAGVDYREGEITNAASLKPDFFADTDTVIHLVGIIVQQRRKGQTFGAVHVEGTENVLRAAMNAGAVRKFVYVSALGASPESESEYSRTKAAAEARVAGSGLAFTIFRPSIILGESGDFVSQIEGLIKRPPLSPFPLPFIPVPGFGKNLFQPVYIDDLVSCLVQSLKLSETNGRTFEIGGADRVTFNALIEAFALRLYIKKPLLHMPMPLLFTAASVLEALLSKPPITVDQLKNLRIDNVCDNAAVIRAFSVNPRSFAQSLEQIPLT